jgi:hypothetical protein
VATWLPGRTGRQCRERWNSYINPILTQAEWTDDEDRLILKKVEEFGQRWHLIAQMLTGRGRNSVHNRYLSLQRKQISQSGSKCPRLEPLPLSTPGDVVTEDRSLLEPFEWDEFSTEHL